MIPCSARAMSLFVFRLHCLFSNVNCGFGLWRRFVQFLCSFVQFRAASSRVQRIGLLFRMSVWSTACRVVRGFLTCTSAHPFIAAALQTCILLSSTSLWSTGVCMLHVLLDEPSSNGAGTLAIFLRFAVWRSSISTFVVASSIAPPFRRRRRCSSSSFARNRRSSCCGRGLSSMLRPRLRGLCPRINAARCTQVLADETPPVKMRPRIGVETLALCWYGCSRRRRDFLRLRVYRDSGIAHILWAARLRCLAVVCFWQVRYEPNRPREILRACLVLHVSKSRHWLRRLPQIPTVVYSGCRGAARFTRWRRTYPATSEWPKNAPRSSDDSVLELCCACLRFSALLPFLECQLRIWALA